MLLYSCLCFVGLVCRPFVVLVLRLLFWYNGPAECWDKSLGVKVEFLALSGFCVSGAVP